MTKELFISSSPHETKVAVLEDDLLVEVYYERDSDVGLVGGIYKGRVNRVLPGMQSAFVDIGLERDAFLYVSDFFEDAEEYDKVFAEAEARATRFAESSRAPGSDIGQAEVPSLGPEKPAAAAAVPPASSEISEPAATPAGSAPVSPPPSEASPAVPLASGPSSAPVRPAMNPPDYRRHEHRGRRRRRGRGFGDQKFTPKPGFRDRPVERHDYGTPHTFEILPGESLAKYSRGTPPGAPSEAAHGAPIEHESRAPAPAELSTGADSAPLAETSIKTASELASLDSSLPSTELPPANEPAVALNAGSEKPSEDATLSSSGSSTEPPPVREESSAKFPAPGETARVPEIRPRPLWDRLKSKVLGETSSAAAQATPTAEESAQGSQSQPAPATGAIEFRQGESASGVTPEVARGPGERKESLSATASRSLDETAAPVPDTTPQGKATSETPAKGEAQETAGKPAEQKYTLREPHQRPRFAPRRGRRGHRGGMGHRQNRPEGGPSSRLEVSRAASQQPLQISELLKEGQEILVQIAKEPLGTKGARITSHIALPGRYLVYLPTIDHIGVSRKIASEEERLRLRNIILENKGSLTGGFIVRTAGQGRSGEELKTDLKFLSTLWNDIRSKAERSKPPALIHRDLDLVQRILRDILSPHFRTIRLDNEIEYERVVEFVNHCQPSLVGHVKLYTRNTPMFEEFGIQAEIDKALKPKVWLKSGGYIVINQTEALVAIDVNTGKYVGKTNRLEDTIVRTNIDAVNEIVRQIRLRDLGGIIVIDFIDMDERKNRLKVVQALEEALRQDRAPTNILTFNEFGLVALTRKRVKQSLERTLCEPCQVCSGSGWIKSVNTVCYEILAEARKMAGEIQGDVLTLRVSPEVAHALKARQGGLISELESLTHKDVVIKSDPTIQQERFEIY